MMTSRELLQGVIDTIDSAKEHQLQLADLLGGLQDAKNQIRESAAQSRAKLQEHFTSLRAEMLTTLDDRLSVLKDQVDQIEAGALDPLNQCEHIIQHGVSNAKDVLQEGKKLLISDHSKDLKEDVETFRSRTSGLSSLPEVPPLSDVACIFVDLPEAASSHLITQIQDYGRVISRAPVQITDIIERPGSLVIKWAETEEECSLDLSEFRLECHYGSYQTGDSPAHFQPLYKGPTSAFTLRHARPHTNYTFRVCGRTEGAGVWSPWSIPRTGMTMLQHYEWRSDVPGYVTSNENKLARRCSNPAGPDVSHPDCMPVLYSTGATYSCGHSLVFKVVEDGPSSQGDGIAISTTCEAENSFCQQGALLVSTEGTVFMDGQQKTTKLPCLKRGSVLTFDTDVLQSGKVRVTIEVNERIVTFDWSVERPVQSLGSGPGSGEDIQLYFAMRFASVGWTVGVE